VPTVTALLIVLGSIVYAMVGYFVAGWVQANTTAAVVASDEAYYAVHPENHEALWREERRFGVLSGIVWPVAVPGLWLVMHISYRLRMSEPKAVKERRP
jgi:hypothetical protein